MPGKKILVVDDEESVLELLKIVLGQAGFDVICAGSGMECIKKLLKIKPDLILMDMMMPGMSGRETTEKIRSDPKTRDIKIAFLTVLKLSEVGQYILNNLKISDYITKPFEAGDLVSRVRRIIA